MDVCCSHVRRRGTLNASAQDLTSRGMVSGGGKVFRVRGHGGGGGHDGVSVLTREKETG